MMFIQKYINTIKQQPLVFFVGICVLSLAVMGTSVRHVSSTVFALLVLLSFFVIKDWGKIFFSLSKLEKLFLIAFFIYMLSGVLSFYNVDDVDKYYKIFERYLRFALIIPVYLFLVKKKISLLNYLYVGSIISGPFLFVVGLEHSIVYPDTPAKGYYHHIIFGQLAMLNVGIMLSMLLTRNISRLAQFIILMSMLFGIVTAVMSQARGVWLVFPIYVLVAVYYVVRDKRINKKNIALLLSVIFIVLLVPSISDLIKQRTEEAVSEVIGFYSGNQYVSSVGTRLAMWDIAIDVWEEYPFLGTGPGDFDNEIIMLQKEGHYSHMDVHNSVHNIYLQALVGSGIVGLMALIFVLLVMPLKIFLDNSGQNKEAQLAGFVSVVSFAIFGVSESWTLRLSITSVFLVYIILIAADIRIARVQKNIIDI